MSPVVADASGRTCPDSGGNLTTRQIGHHQPIPSPAVAKTRLVADLLRDAAGAFPERDAYVHGEKRATYAWLDRAADGFAATLLEHGVGRGEVVVLLLPSSIKLAVCYLGALRVGAITSAVNLRLGPREQRSILERTRPRVTVVGDGASVPDEVDAGVVLPVDALKDAFAAAPPARLPTLDPSDPDLHRLDERYDRRAEGRGVRPRAAGRDLPQRRRAHRTR